MNVKYFGWSNQKEFFFLVDGYIRDEKTLRFELFSKYFFFIAVNFFFNALRYFDNKSFGGLFPNLIKKITDNNFIWEQAWEIVIMLVLLYSVFYLISIHKNFVDYKNHENWFKLFVLKNFCEIDDISNLCVDEVTERNGRLRILLYKRLVKSYDDYLVKYSYVLSILAPLEIFYAFVSFLLFTQVCIFGISVNAFVILQFAVEANKTFFFLHKVNLFFYSCLSFGAFGVIFIEALNYIMLRRAFLNKLFNFKARIDLDFTLCKSSYKDSLPFLLLTAPKKNF